MRTNLQMSLTATVVKKKVMMILKKMANSSTIHDEKIMKDEPKTNQKQDYIISYNLPYHNMFTKKDFQNILR